MFEVYTKSFYVTMFSVRCKILVDFKKGFERVVINFISNKHILIFLEGILYIFHLLYYKITSHTNIHL